MVSACCASATQLLCHVLPHTVHQACIENAQGGTCIVNTTEDGRHARLAKVWKRCFVLYFVSLCEPEHSGGSMCVHGRQRNHCKDCGGVSLCKHKRQKSRCKECGGSGICEHGRQRWCCSACKMQVKSTSVHTATVMARIIVSPGCIVECKNTVPPDKWCV